MTPEEWKLISIPWFILGIYLMGKYGGDSPVETFKKIWNYFKEKKN